MAQNWHVTVATCNSLMANNNINEIIIKLFCQGFVIFKLHMDYIFIDH